MYRAQVGSEGAKRARWFFESRVQPRAASGIATRNSLMNEPVSNLAGRDRSRTDILHEYFVPPERFGEFVDACQAIIPRSSLEFLNVTLRYVGPDADSVLAFAPERRIAAVMSFSQPMHSGGGGRDGARDRSADRARHCHRRQLSICPTGCMRAASRWPGPIPTSERFVERKRHYDPHLLFRNAMWQAYFADMTPSCS